MFEATLGTPAAGFRQCHRGVWANVVIAPSLDRIIEQLQFCIIDARALQLAMLERLLSIALLEAIEGKDKSLIERVE